jgi:predicted phage terminase large subunit-like protein
MKISSAESRAIFRNDFPTFIEKVFATVSPGDEFRHNWHINAIAYDLEQLREGKNRRLIINQPPRTLKSICASVAFPAFVLGHDPASKIVCASYANTLAEDLHQQFRNVVMSDWYRDLFPHVRPVKDTSTEFGTTAGGFRFATSVGGTLTGRGGGFIIIDDPLKADEGMGSDIARNKVIEWFKTTVLSRQNDPERSRIAVVMQRLHEDDLSGYLLERGGWRTLCLPAIFEEEAHIDVMDTPSPRIVSAGSLLHEERLSREVLAERKDAMGSGFFSAQYLQLPVPPKGHTIKRDWFRTYSQLPKKVPVPTIIQSWDIASSIGERRDWSVCTIWSRQRNEYYLVDVWRGRLETPGLVRKIVDLSKMYAPPPVVLIEDAMPGSILLQDFRRQTLIGMETPIGIKPQGSKQERMALHSHRIERGQVFLPEDADWKATFLHELLTFPFGRNDDQVDSVSQFLEYASKSEAVYLEGPTIDFGPMNFTAERSE